MFNQKLIQKKINVRSREDILSSKIEAKALNKFHNDNQSENAAESKKKAKKAKRKAEREKRKFDNLAISNDQYNNSSKRTKEDDGLIKFSKEELPLKENNEKGNINWNMNKDLKKSKFNRYFHAEVNDSQDDNPKNDRSIDDYDNISPATPKIVKDKKDKNKKQKSYYNESNRVIEKVRSKTDKSFLFTFEDSSSSGEEEVFEPWLTTPVGTQFKSVEHNDNLESSLLESDHNDNNCPNNNHREEKVVENSPEQAENDVEMPQEQTVDTERPYKSRRQQKMELIAAEREQQLLDKRTIVGKVLAMEVVSDEKLAVALLPGKRIYFNGTVVVTPLVGSVNVLGYTIGVGSSHMVSSPDSQALLGLLPKDTHQITKSFKEELLAAGLSHQFIKELQGHKKPLALLLLSRCDVPSINFLRTLGCPNMSLPHAQGEWADVLDTELITIKNCKYYTLLEESPQWMSIIDKLLSDYKQGKCLKVLICGGQRSGKSTLFRYVINSLLNSDSIDNVKCLDLDPGQPEFSLPTTLSCTTVSQPLLEPPFLHQIPKDEMKAVVLGTTSTMYVVEEYGSCLKSLLSNTKENNLPLIINTMGWTNGIGLDVMLDTIRIIEPSHVIQIHNPQDHRNNFEVKLTSDHVLNSQGGMITKLNTQDEVDYDFLEVTSVDRYPSVKKPLRGSTIRDFRVFSEFSHLLEDEEQGEKNIVRIPWSSMVLHVCGRQVPRENILQVLNASLVALCHITPSMIIEPPRPNLPKQLLLEELRSHPAECRGWAVVRGIDPLTQHIHLLTNLSEKEVLENVNAIIMTQLYLPQELYMYYSQGEGPYIQNLRRTGAGITISKRRIQPRATKRDIARFIESQNSSQHSTPPHNREFSTERKQSKSLRKEISLDNSDTIKDKDYYESSWT